MNRIKLGSKVKDVRSGFEGVLVARAEYLDSPADCMIDPYQHKDGTPVKPTWVPEKYVQALVGGSHEDVLEDGPGETE